MLLSFTLIMLWGHERIRAKRTVLRANVEECWNGEERRQHKRMEKNLEVEYSVEKKPHLKNGKTVNISEGGMKLRLDEKLAKGTIVDLKIYMPENNKTIEVEGEVSWTKECDGRDASGKRFFHSGIKFITMKGSSGTHLCECLAPLEHKNP